MSGYHLFYLFFILAIWSILISVVDFTRRNYETPGPILFLCSLIGLSCNYTEWARTFSGMYNIVWWG